MTQEEIILFKELCKFKSSTIDEAIIEHASPEVLGQLFFNRMQGIAYIQLKNSSLLTKTNREFRNSLKSAHEQNVIKNNSFFKCVEMISNILLKCKHNVAMLKGSLLCVRYPEGCRTSNDIDLLMLPENVTEVGELLKEAGFKQGSIKNGEFVEATRKEIIESKMMRGETVPYIKQVDLPSMKFLEVDINFSLDYKNGDDNTLANILNHTQIINESGLQIPTLSAEDFFIHLCAHLYKEATTLPWIEMHRDMTLYKYSDIYMLLLEMTESDIDRVFVRAKELGMELICSYVILSTAELFDVDESKAITLSKGIIKTDQDFLFKVIDPKDKKTFKYQTENIVERFFLKNRKNDLVEVNANGKTKNA